MKNDDLVSRQHILTAVFKSSQVIFQFIKLFSVHDEVLKEAQGVEITYYVNSLPVFLKVLIFQLPSFNKTSLA